MLDTFHGLPTHALIVHFTVVALPTAAITGIIVALWPWARRRYGVLVGLLTLATIVLLPVTVRSGKDFYAAQSARFGPAQATEAGLMQRHMDLALAMQKWAYLMCAGILLVLVPPAIAWSRARNNRVSVEAGGRSAVSGDGTHRARSNGGMLGRLELSGPDAPRWQLPVMAIGIVLTIVAGLLTLIMVARVGEAGAKAAWEHVNVPAQSQSN